jgi:lysophospholipase L1-like esterase
MGYRSLTKRKVLFWTILIFAQLVFIETGIRVLLAFHVGPRILFYGTERRTKVVDPPPHNIGRAANSGSGYIKYFPNERKVDYKPETGEAFSVVMNSRGFRGREFTAEKPPGVTRIVTLGSSSTFGYRSKDDETYPFHLEEILNRQYPNKRFEVINLGIPHLKSAQILALFYAEGLQLNPDFVTIYEGINDSGTLAPVPSVEANLPRVPRQTLGERLASLEWLMRIYRGTRNISLAVAFVESFLNDSATHDESAVEKYLAERNRYFLANISAIRDECAKRGIEFIVVSQQARSLLLKKPLKGITYDAEAEIVRNKLDTGRRRLTFNEVAFLRHHALNQEIRSWVASKYVRFVDAIAALDHDRDVLLSWVHLTPRGNRLIAEAIAREVSVAISAPSTG